MDREYKPESVTNPNLYAEDFAGKMAEQATENIPASKDYLSIATGKAFQTAKAKIHIKLVAAVVVLLVTGAIAWAVLGRFSIALIPFILTLAPIGMFVYNWYGFKHNMIKGAIAQVVEDKADIVEGVLSGFTARKKYLFDYETEDEEEGSFWISRGGWFTTMSPGKYYLILYRNSAPPSASNFLGCEELQGRLFGKEVTTDTEKREKRKSGFRQNIADAMMTAREQLEEEQQNRNTPPEE